jgi:hypothetical protein
MDLALVTAVGCFNGINNVVNLSEGNRMFPGQASAVSALLMGLPWCFAATASFIAGTLANPASGGTPTTALTWLGLTIPMALAISVCVRARRANTPASTNLDIALVRGCRLSRLSRGCTHFSENLTFSHFPISFP